MARRRRTLPDLDRSGGFIGVAGIACLLFLYLASAPLLGAWTTVGLVVVWLVLLYAAIRMFTPYPRRVLLLPVLGFLFWLAPVIVANR